MVRESQEVTAMDPDSPPSRVGRTFWTVWVSLEKRDV